MKKINKNKGEIEMKFPFKKGEKYFIRTATYHMLGRVKNIVGNFLVLEKASWIADSGRFTQFIDDGLANEIEPVKSLVYLNIESIIDAFDWHHSLYRDQK